MCYSNCSFENRDGECTKRKIDLCPLDYEDENELAEAARELAEIQDDFKYNQWLDRQLAEDAFGGS